MPPKEISWIPLLDIIITSIADLYFITDVMIKILLHTNIIYMSMSADVVFYGALRFLLQYAEQELLQLDLGVYCPNFFEHDFIPKC